MEGSSRIKNGPLSLKHSKRSVCRKILTELQDIQKRTLHKFGGIYEAEENASALNINLSTRKW